MLMLLLASLDSEEERQLLAAFYLAHNDNLFRYACSILKDSSLAEEALSASWIKCMENMETFLSVPADRRIYWMSVVVKNTALTLGKREKRHDSIDPADWDPAAPESQDPQRAQEHQSIVEVIHSMPEQYRTILELKFLLEWSDQQIADYVGLTRGAVSTRINRGRKLLQKKLREEGYHL